MIKTGVRVKLGELKPLGPKRDLTHDSDSLACPFFFLYMFIQQSFNDPWCVSRAIVGAGECKN